MIFSQPVLEIIQEVTYVQIFSCFKFFQASDGNGRIMMRDRFMID